MARAAVNGNNPKAGSKVKSANGVSTEAGDDVKAAASEGSEKARQWYAAGTISERAAKVTEALRDTKRAWYGEPHQVQAYMDLALCVASSAPNKAYELCGALVHGFARPDLSKLPDSGAIKIGGESFKNRMELKIHCKRILERHATEERLGTMDQNFIRKLLVHHPRGAEKAQGCMAIAVGQHAVHQTRCFFVVREGEDPDDFSYVRCVDNTPTRESNAADRMCEVLVEVLRMHPTASMAVANLLEERFPHHLIGTVEFHRNYVRSLLQIATHLPPVTCYLLRVLIGKMSIVDVQIAKKVDTIEDQEIADDDVDRMSPVLDAMMMKVLEFLQQRLTKKEPTEQENVLVMSLLGIFETHVLTTYRSRYVQFLFFYISSLRPQWTEDFLTLLLRCLYNLQESPVKRRMAAAYLGSFVCRASFLTIKYSLQTTKYLVAFAKEQLNSKELYREGAAWQLIVSVVQAIAYIICFKAVEFAEAAVEEAGSRSCLEDLLSPGDNEGFVAVLRSPARPFQAIIHRVQEECRRALRPFAPNLVDEAMCLSGQDPFPDSEEIDSSFPFDPYNLRSSHIFLMGIYKEWSSVSQAKGDMMLDEDEESETDPESGVDVAGMPRGFAGRNEKPVRKVSAHSSEDVESHADDFTDAADVELRGFIPSCGPSPAFHPRRINGSMEFSPFDVTLPVQMEMDDDTFALPGPSVPVQEDSQADQEDSQADTYLNSMLNNAAYNNHNNHEKRKRMSSGYMTDI